MGRLSSRIRNAATLLLLTLLGSGLTPASAETERYQEIRIPWPDEAERRVIAEHSALEVMGFEQGLSVRYLSRPSLTRELVESGVDVEIIHDDLQAFYTDRMSRTARGSTFGAFYSYAEMVAELDALHAEFPDITTDKIDIGTSWEGNTIWAMKVSDNPDVEEDEPEVLIDALHHARETITVSVALASIRDLCENYGSDPEITTIVDERQVWFVPIVNPDGYLYNESIAPNGGGLWRKNRRDDLGSCVGVDLNRNYAFEWGGSGSSGNECENNYRGPAPFSELETSAIRNLMMSHEFVTHDSFHSVVGILLYPWGYTTADNPEDAVFDAIAQGRIRDSGYTPGPAGQILYLAAGNSMDYAYGETGEKPSIYSFTTEVDGSGFWPQESEIPGLVAENLYSNIFLSLVAGVYLQLTDVAVDDGGNAQLDPGETANLLLSLENVGVVADALGVSLTVETDDAYIQLLDVSASLGDLPAGTSTTNAGDAITLSADPETPEGYEALLEVRCEWSEGESVFSVSLTIGTAPIVAADDFESGAGGWSLDPSSNATSGDWVLIDPNATDFQPGDDTTPAPGVTAWITGQNSSVGTDDVDSGATVLRSPVFDLSGYANVDLSMSYFFGQRDPGDDGSDGFRVSLSADGGATFPVDVLDIGDVFQSPDWQNLAVDVDDEIALTDQFVVQITAIDGQATGDIVEGGIDDFVLLDGGSGNTAPSMPVPIAPVDGAVDQPGDATLTVVNASDLETDPLTYGFRIYDDAALTSLVRAADDVPEVIAVTSWTVDPPLADGTYYWRAFAEDPETRGLLSATQSFTVGTVVGAPTADVSTPAAVGSPSPNPFTYRTEIAFSLPAGGPVRVDVFDVRGRRVRSLYRGLMPAGQRSLVWDRRDQRGSPVGAGEYFVQVRLDGRLFTRKAIVLE